MKKYPHIPLLVGLLCFFVSYLMNAGEYKAERVPAANFLKETTTNKEAQATIAATTSTENFSPVLRVVDGDTIDVELSGERVRVRLIGINTPEIVDPRRPVQCFGRESSAKAEELLLGTAVRLETDPSQGRYDKYGRLLAYVYLPDGRSFNKEMIAQGYAYEYTYRLPYRYQSEFKAAQARAREAALGLWSPSACPQ